MIMLGNNGFYESDAVFTNLQHMHYTISNNAYGIKAHLTYAAGATEAFVTTLRCQEKQHHEQLVWMQLVIPHLKGKWNHTAGRRMLNCQLKQLVPLPAPCLRLGASNCAGLQV